MFERSTSLISHDSEPYYKSNSTSIACSEIYNKLTCCTDGEEHLHGIEEEEHHQQWYGGSQWKAERVHRVQRCEFICKTKTKNIISIQTTSPNLTNTHTLLLLYRFAGDQVVHAFALALFLLLALFLFHVETPEATVHDQEHRDETRGHPGRVHDGVRGPLAALLLLLLLLKKVVLLQTSGESFRHCARNRRPVGLTEVPHLVPLRLATVEGRGGSRW